MPSRVMLAAIGGLLVIAACTDKSAPLIEQEFARDPDAFTQGLEFYGGYLYESSGLYGKSFLRKSKLDNGRLRTIEEISLPPQWFAEGLTFVGDRLYVLTWREGIVSIRDSETLEEIEQKHYEGEGWGLAFDGISLWMSDGSSWLTERDPETFQVIQRVQVTYQGRPVERLNELEWDGRHLYANQWKTDYIYQVDLSPKKSGSAATEKANEATALKANKRLQFRHPHSNYQNTSNENVLNGIAHKNRTLYVTGKHWDRVFAIPIIYSK